MIYYYWRLTANIPSLDIKRGWKAILCSEFLQIHAPIFNYRLEKSASDNWDFFSLFFK